MTQTAATPFPTAAQFSACGFAATPDPAFWQHARGLTVQLVDIAGPAGIIVDPPEPWMAGPVPLRDEADLSALCWSHELVTPFAQVRAVLAPWPGEAAVEGVCYRDGPDIRARTARGDTFLTLRGSSGTRPLAFLNGQPWPEEDPQDPWSDPRHGQPWWRTPGGLLGVYDVQGGQGGEMVGTLTLTRGTRHVVLDFEDWDVDSQSYVFPPRGTPEEDRGASPVDSPSALVALLEAHGTDHQG